MRRRYLGLHDDLQSYWVLPFNIGFRYWKKYRYWHKGGYIDRDARVAELGPFSIYWG